MKHFAFTIAFLLPLALFSQTIEYFTADWKRTKNKDKAAYYREITYDAGGRPVGVVKNYYISGQLQWQGYITAINKDAETRHGWCTWYYPNGQFQQQSYYFYGKRDSTTFYWNEKGDLTGEEDYKNNLLDGMWIRYFPNKKPRLVAMYVNGRMKDNVYLEYDESGIPLAVYPEYFDYAANWTLYNNSSDYFAEVKNNRLWLGTKTNRFRACGYKYVPFAANSNFSIEASVSFDKGNNDVKSHGIIWGVKDASNYDYFIINSRGAFQTGYVENGKETVTLAWTNSAVIKTGKSPNLLKVIKAFDKYYFMINGKSVATATYQPLMGTYAGVTVASGIESIYCDLFLVQQDLNATPAAKNPPEGSAADSYNFTGSGILIDKNGFVATNEHVITGAQAIEVEFVKDNKVYSFKAEVVKADAAQDLAILKITDSRYNSFKPASLPYGISTKLLDLGASVFALGYPETDKLGKNIKFTDGKISAQTGVQDNPFWYQISVPIQHGNSGGPLFDSDGNVVGLTNAGIPNMSNVAYAIKSNLLLQMLKTSFPGTYNTPVNIIKDKPLTEKIKLLKGYVPFIKVWAKQ
jgi:S1-C subfamily serine protease